jgi:hypothetical protein
MVISRSARPAGRDREAAVADHGGGDAERRRGRERRVPGDLGVEVGVAVDDAGHQRQAVGLDDAPGTLRVADARRDAHDPSLGDGDVGPSGRRAAAVEQLGAADQEVDHYAVFSSGAANSDSISRRTL